MPDIGPSYLSLEKQSISCLALNPTFVLGSQVLNVFYPCWRWYRRLRFVQDHPNKIGSFFAINISCQVVSMTALRSKKVGPLAKSLADALNKLARSTDLVRATLEVVQQQFTFSRALGAWVRVIKKRPHVTPTLYPQLSQRRVPIRMQRVAIKISEVAVATLYLLWETLKLLGSYIELYEWRKVRDEWLNHSAWDLYQNIEIINEFYQKNKDLLLETLDTNGGAIEKLSSLFYLPMKVGDMRVAIQSSSVIISTANAALNAANYVAVKGIQTVGNMSPHQISNIIKRGWHKVKVWEGKTWQWRHPLTLEDRVNGEGVVDEVGEIFEKIAQEVMRAQNKEQEGIDDFFERLKS